MGELRIIGGCYKNRLIKMRPKSGIRPSLARTRKILFDVLLGRMEENFTFLDGFAGSGAMGLEALSNGAFKVFFFELDKTNIRYVKENARKMENIKGSFEAFCVNTLRPPKGSPVDIIFLDPPFEKSTIIKDVVKKLKKYNWINQDTHLVTEVNKKTDLNINEFTCWKERAIGQTKLNFWYSTEELVKMNAFD